MKIGFIYPYSHSDPEEVARIGVTAETLGFDYLLAYDHVLGAQRSGRDRPLDGPYGLRDPFHDPLLLFTFLSALTVDLEFATGVLVLPQRQTALVARQAATLAILCHDRLRLGVGAGWNYVEFQAMGAEFATRGTRLDEQIPLLRRLWREEMISTQGEFHQIERAGLLPRPKSDIPIWIGGYGDRAFRRGAELGDGFMFTGTAEQNRGSTPQAVVDRAVSGLRRFRELRDASGGISEDFGLELLVNSQDRAGVKVIADAWRGVGGTHLCISSAHLGAIDLAKRLDYMSAVVDAAR